MPRFTFVIGKGGVGKTTVSSSLALYLGARHPRSKILLLSTDPAHSLADVLQVPLDNAQRKLRSPGRVYARQLSAETAVANFLAEQREGILRILESGSLFTREELEPLLDSALPGMAEVAALLAIQDLIESDFDDVIVDTAPMGHTLRLFELPAHLERFLHLLEIAGSRDQVLAAHFGGRTTQNLDIVHWQHMVQQITEALGRERSRMLLVTSPETFSLNEAVRARDQLRSATPSFEIDEVVLNRVVLRPEQCVRCRAQAKRSAAARTFLKREFRDATMYLGEDPGSPILGPSSLLAFGKHVFGGGVLKLRAPRTQSDPDLPLAPAPWPVLEKALTLTTGKGGVGKTTISAGMAFHSRQKDPGMPVTIASIDPAPSLDDVFATAIGNRPTPVLHDPRLRAAEIDSVAEYQLWADEMRDRVQRATSSEVRGVHLDLSFERDLFLAVLDVVPPGVDEIFAAFRILELVEHGMRAQIDMAPTGHALEILRTPARLLGWTRVLLKTLAHHRTLPLARDAAVEIATVSQKVRELASILSDPTRSQVWVVMLAEPLPDRETRRLLDELVALQAPVAGIFVNRVLFDAAGCSRCARRQSAQGETLRAMRKSKLPVFVVPEFKNEIIGQRGLERLTRKLWRLQ